MAGILDGPPGFVPSTIWGSLNPLDIPWLVLPELDEGTEIEAGTVGCEIVDAGGTEDSGWVAVCAEFLGFFFRVDAVLGVVCVVAFLLGGMFPCKIDKKKIGAVHKALKLNGCYLVPRFC